MLYADDILLYRPVSSDGDFTVLQSDINMIQTWATSNFMTFNESSNARLAEKISVITQHTHYAQWFSP